MDVVIYLIALSRRGGGRRVKERGALKGYNINVFDAYDGTKLNPHHLARSGLISNNATLSTTEMACALSHDGVWREFFTRRKEEYCLIIEDDVFFDIPFSEFKKIEIPKDADLIMFGGGGHRHNGMPRGLKKLEAHHRVGYGAYGYMISKKGAQALISRGSIRCEPDVALEEEQYHRTINAYVYNPMVIKHDDKGRSSIHRCNHSRYVLQRSHEQQDAKA